jgi:hypothetical protein
MPDVQQNLAAQGAQVAVQGPDGFSKFLADEVRKWAAVAKRANIRIE